MRKLLTIATAVLCASATLATAQSDEPFLVGTIFLEAGGEGNEIGIESDDFERTNPKDLQDIFKAEPTISVSSPVPLSQKVYVNGVEENNLAVTVDGSRQNNKIFHHNGTNLIDPALLKQVRVDPGVAPADAGPGALGGAIAYETKDVDDLLEPGRNFGGTFSSQFQTNGDVFDNSISVFGRQGAFEAMGFLKFADGDDRQDGGGSDIVGSGTHFLSGLGKVAFETTGGDRFELSYENVHDDDVRPYRADIGLINGGRPVPLTRSYDLRRENVVFNYSHFQPTDMWDPKAVLSYSATELTAEDASDLSEGKTGGFNGLFQNTFTLGFGTITAGVDFYSIEAEYDYVTFGEAGSEKAQNYGAYVQARLSPSDQARVSVGARFDYQDFEGIDGTKYSNSGFSGNLSGEYDLTEAITFSAGASHVWGGVDTAENYIMNAGWVYPEDSIDPVTSDSYFLAARARTGSWSFRAKVFQTKIDNARSASYGAGPDITSDMEAKGYELGAEYSWDHGFVRLGYANVESDVNDNPSESFTGRYLTTPIGEIVTLEVAHDLADLGLLVGADARFAFEEDGTYISDIHAPGDPLPSFEVLNAFAEYTPEALPSLTVRAEVNNIFDEEYSARSTYGQEYPSVESLREPGRSFTLRGTISF